ncbi:MAG: spore germination protein [Firmicutes bacterium]|nr:spore germination protein [Bacillota bacterium]
MKTDRLLKNNINFLTSRFSKCEDLVSHSFDAGGKLRLKVYITYFDDLVDRKLIEKQVIRGLLVDACFTESTDLFLKTALMTADYSTMSDLSKASDEILAGNTLLLAEGFDKAFVISS